LTLLGSLVSNPAHQTVNWLDLACGEGQILTGMHNGFAEEDRRKIAYTGFDRMDAYLRATEKIASASGLRVHPRSQQPGHQRTIITIQKQYFSEWLSPAAVNRERLEHILSDKELPYYVH
jgi:hypothetical protein